MNGRIVLRDCFDQKIIKLLGIVILLLAWMVGKLKVKYECAASVVSFHIFISISKSLFREPALVWSITCHKLFIFYPRRIFCPDPG